MKLVRQTLATDLTDSVLAQLSQNKKLDSLIVKFIPENTDYKPGTIRKVRRNGINYILDISEYQNWLIYFGIAADDTIPLFKLVREGDVILDVGANIGQTSLNCARLAGPSGKVFGFEPDPVNFKQCEVNKELNSYPGVTFFNFALGEEQTSVVMQLGERNRGGNSIVNNTTNEKCSIRIDLKSMDEFAKEKNLEKISIVKIDVEGYELNVLKGAVNCLRKYRPTLYIEIDESHLKRQNHTPQDIFNFLQDHGYMIHDTDGNPVSIDKNYSGCHFDIICEPADKLSQ